MVADWLNVPDGPEAEASSSTPSPILYSEIQNHPAEPAEPINEFLSSELQKTLRANRLDPTSETYSNLIRAFDFFNERYFDGTLPRPMITLRGTGKAAVSYLHHSFGTVSGTDRIDEIAVNARRLLFTPPDEFLDEFVHVLCHIWQAHFGAPTRNGYHNKQFADKLRSVGLIPSPTGKKHGKETGQLISQYRDETGAFARACQELIDVHGFVLNYGDLTADQAKSVPGEPERPKPNSGITYVCTTPGCPVDLKGKPGAPFVRVSCVDCNSLLIDKEKVDRFGADFPNCDEGETP
jgi:hypothetical protein